MDLIGTPLEYSLRGKLGGKTICLIHGWPDDSTLWNQLVDVLEVKNRCISVTLPGFCRLKSAERGADFPVLVERLQKTIEEVHDVDPESPLILIGPDWGAYLCYLYEARYRDRLQGIVTLDVGGQIEISSLAHGAYLVGYQGWLISAWLIGKVCPPVGTWMSRALARAGSAPRPERVKSKMNYLYFYFWRAMLFKKYGASKLEDYVPQVASLFLFGKAKRYMFHSVHWLEAIRSKHDSAAYGICEAGHWLMLDKPKEVNSIIEQWISS